MITVFVVCKLICIIDGWQWLESLPWDKRSTVYPLVLNIHRWIECGTAVWKAFFPGVQRYVESRITHNQHLQFMEFICTNGYTVKGLFTVNQNHRQTRHNPDAKGFGSRNYRSMIVGDLRLTIADFTNPIGDRRGASNAKYRGLANFEHVIRKGMLRQGPEALAAALHEQPMIMLDAGFVNELGGVVAVGNFDEVEGNLYVQFKTFLFPTSAHYSRTRNLGRVDGSDEERIKALRDLAATNGKTTDNEQFTTFIDTFNQHFELLYNGSSTIEALKHQARLKASIIA